MDQKVRCTQYLPQHCSAIAIDGIREQEQEKLIGDFIVTHVQQMARFN